MKRALLCFVCLALIFTAACGGTSKPKATAAGQPPAAVNAAEVGAVLAKGLADHQAGDIPDAQKAYEQVLAADPSNKFALYNMGLISQTSGKSKEAENFYRRSLLQDPDFPSALFNLAIVRAAQPNGQREAIDLYRHLIAIEPNNPSAHNNLGVVLKAVGQTADGEAEMQLAAQLRQPAPSAPPANLPTPPATIGRP